MAGGYIIETIDEDLTYDYLHSSEENLWSILYLTGYLTRAREEQLAEKVPQGAVALMIPNAEIRDIFETTVKKWFCDSAKMCDRKPLFDAVWNGDEERLTREMTKLLRRTISYHDYREDFYHAFLAGIFAGAGYMVKSNQEQGEGRSDVIVYDAANSRAVVFEAKYSRDSSQLETDCEKAIRQIDDKMYAEELEDDFDEVLCYGIAFYKKRSVRRVVSSFRDLRMIPSLRESRLEVGSSRSKRGLSWRKALAIPILCFSPPERVSPSSPTSVSYPLGRVMIKSWMEAFFAAAMISSRVAPGFAMAMLFAMESWNRWVSCVT